MTQIWSLIGLIAAIHGILLGVIFYLHPKLDKKKRLYFSLIIIPFSFCLAEYSGYWSYYLLRYPHLAFTTISLPYLFGPFLFFLTREFTDSESRFNFKDLLHFIPAILLLVLNFDFYLNTAKEKEQILRLLIYSYDPQFDNVFYILKSVLFIQMIIYVVSSWKISAQLIKREKQFLRVLAIGIGLYITQSFIQAINIYLSGYEFIFQFGATLVISSSLMLYFVTYASIFNPLFLSKDNPERYKGNKFGVKVIESINKKVIDYLLRNEKFYEKKLSINQIAKDIQIPPHHISQAVNLGLQMNITDLINKYRVDEVKERLVDPKFSHYSILAIGLDAGFSTKASFYNAFKKHVGITPTDYVRTSNAK